MGASNNSANEHLEKQRKRKDLSDEMIYGSQNGVIEMHKLFNYKIGNEKLGDILANLIKENNRLNGRLDTAKSVIETLNGKIKTIEKRLNDYGI